ncbi:unnamed protein product [Rhodiola kirilowii]
MASSLTLVSASALVFLLLQYVHVSESRDAPTFSDDLVRSSCVHASYPDICLHTLSSYPDPPTTPREVAQAGVKVSLAHAKKFSHYLTEQKGGKKREKTALKDCLEQMGDSMYELDRTLSELEDLKEGSGFRFQMSNAETWVSSALSDDETCLDSLWEAAGKGKPKEDVRKRVVAVAKVTSNALYLINQLDAKRG